MKDENRVTEKEPEEGSNKKISRRDFLKYSAGAAAVAAGATGLMGKIPLPADLPKTTKPSPINQQSGGIVVTIEGDQLTVMSGQNEVKVKDSGLAAEIASKIQ